MKDLKNKIPKLVSYICLIAVCVLISGCDAVPDSMETESAVSGGAVGPGNGSAPASNDFQEDESVKEAEKKPLCLESIEKNIMGR